MEKGWRKEREKSDLIESLPRMTQSRKLKPTIQVSCEPKSSRIQKPYIGDAQLARSVEISYKVVVQQGLTHRENV